MQNAKCKRQNDGPDLSERLLEFSAVVVKFTNKLDRSVTGRHIGNQLLRASTSCGASYEEACAAESRADFVHKMQIVLKEIRESRYWLRLIEKVGLFPESDVANLLRESDELVNIFAKSVITAKRPIR